MAIIAGKLLNFIIKIKGGGGTAAPGLYALKIDNQLVSKLSGNFRNTIIVSGTNGKTTTSRLIASLIPNKESIIHNRQGSNLMRGVASQLIKETNIFGHFNKATAIWEIDEATLPEALIAAKPNYIVLLNLFRDQLDRYGEIETVRKKWELALNKLPTSSTVVLNADDPIISSLAPSVKAKKVFFGVESVMSKMTTVENVGDVKYCFFCNSKLDYSKLYSAHLGIYKCQSCDFQRPNPEALASTIIFKNDLTSSFRYSYNKTNCNLSYNMPGFFNVYNVLAACTLAQLIGVTKKQLQENLKSFQPAFGRFQKFTVEGKRIISFLIKNPAGTNEVIRTVSTIKNTDLLVILNDNIADGRDVSWIWDTNWEALQGKIGNLFFSGSRSWDIANRFKYASFKIDKNNVHKHIYYSINNALSKMNKNNTLIILPTYTALIEVQDALHKIGGLEKWQKG